MDVNHEYDDDFLTIQPLNFSLSLCPHHLGWNKGSTVMVIIMFETMTFDRSHGKNLCKRERERERENQEDLEWVEEKAFEPVENQMRFWVEKCNKEHFFVPSNFSPFFIPLPSSSLDFGSEMIKGRHLFKREREDGGEEDGKKKML